MLVVCEGEAVWVLVFGKGFLVSCASLLWAVQYVANVMSRGAQLLRRTLVVYQSPILPKGTGVVFSSFQPHLDCRYSTYWVSYFSTSSGHRLSGSATFDLLFVWNKSGRWRTIWRSLASLTSQVKSSKAAFGFPHTRKAAPSTPGASFWS